MRKERNGQQTRVHELEALFEQTMKEKETLQCQCDCLQTELLQKINAESHRVS